MYPVILKYHYFCTFWNEIHCILKNNRRGKRRRNEQISLEYVEFLGGAESEQNTIVPSYPHLTIQAN